MSQLSTTRPDTDRSGTRRRQPSVLVVLVVKDAEPWLRDCLRSLGRQSHPRLGVVAVDNGSTDGSAELLARALGEDRVISLPGNPGLPSAVQAALRLEAAGRADYLLILHDDTALEPDAVTRLVEAAERIDGVGVVGPKVVDWDDPRILRDVGSSTDQFGYPYSPLEEDELDQGQYDRVREVLFVSSAAMLVSRAAVQRAGPPDERFAFSHEDLDFCWRVRLTGHRVLMSPAAVVRHRAASLRGERGPGHASRARYQVERATLAAMLKNLGLLSLLWVFPLYVFQGLAKVILWTLSRRFEDVWQLISAWGWNLVHLPGTFRRRLRAQSVRRVPDRAVRRYMAPLTLRVRRALEAAQGLFGRGYVEAEEAERPLEEQEELELPSVGARAASLARAHPAATAWLLFAVVAAFAYRHLVGPGPLEGGALPTFPAAPIDFFRELGSGFRTTVLGGTDAASPALAILGAISTALFSSTELALKALLILLPPLAGLTFYRAVVRQTGLRGPAVAGAACYGLSAVLLWAFSDGRIAVLVALAVLPPLAFRLQGAFGRGRPRPLRLAVEAGMILAVGAAFFPGVVLAFAVAVAGHVLFPDDEGNRLRGAGYAALAAVAAGALLFPFAIGIAGGRGAALGSTAGVADFSSLVRLAPDGGPGSWSVSWFLPAAALLGFTLLEQTARRAGLRYLFIAIVSLFMAWLSAAGYLPGPFSNPAAYLVAAALAYCTLIAFGLSAVTGIEGRAFGYRHLAAVVVGTLVAGGLALQALLAVGGSWAIDRNNLPPAWTLVDRSSPAQKFRVLWIGRRSGLPFPAPGGDAIGTVTSGGTTLRFGITDRRGVSALDTGRGEAGPGYRYLERVLAEILSGDTSHAGALLGPLGVRFVVAGPGDLPEAAVARLDRQLDLDAVPSVGLTIYHNARDLPEAFATSQEEYARAASSGALADIAALPPPSGSSLHPVPGGFAGTAPSGKVSLILGDQFSSSWQASFGAARVAGVDRAFGWGVGASGTGGGTVSLEWRNQWVRTAELTVLGLLWLVALWLTRKPARREAPR